MFDRRSALRSFTEPVRPSHGVLPTPRSHLKLGRFESVRAPD